MDILRDMFMDILTSQNILVFTSMQHGTDEQIELRLNNDIKFSIKRVFWDSVQCTLCFEVLLSNKL